MKRTTEEIETAKESFEVFRKMYRGKKRKLDTEFKCFQKHKDWFEVGVLLLPALIKQIKSREYKLFNGEWVPQWKYLSTWLNQRCWEEEEYEPQPQEEKPRVMASDYFKTK